MFNYFGAVPNHESIKMDIVRDTQMGVTRISLDRM